MKFKAEILSIAILLLSLMGYSQQSIPWDDLKKINDVFLSTDSYIIKSQYTMFKGTDKTPVESFSGLVKKKNKDMYYKLGQTEIFIKGKKQFMIKHDDKFAVLNNSYTPASDDYSLQGVSYQLEFLKNSNANVKYADLDKNTGVFKYYTNTNKQVLELYYNKTNYYISKLIVFKDYNDYGKSKTKEKGTYTLVIDYSSVILSPNTISDTDFSFDKYLSDDKGVYKLKPSYSTYKLISN